jgi:hypothetical protein
MEIQIETNNHIMQKRNILYQLLTQCLKIIYIAFFMIITPVKQLQNPTLCVNFWK